MNSKHPLSLLLLLGAAIFFISYNALAQTNDEVPSDNNRVSKTQNSVNNSPPQQPSSDRVVETKTGDTQDISKEGSADDSLNSSPDTSANSSPDTSANSSPDTSADSSPGPSGDNNGTDTSTEGTLEENGSQNRSTPPKTSKSADFEDCPKGCIPFHRVRGITGNGHITKQKCTPGCIALEEVESLKEPSPNQNPSARPKPGTSREPEMLDQKGADKLVDGYLSHMIFQPTALGPKKKQHSLLGYAAGAWKWESGLTDNLAISGYALLPVGIMGFGAKLKLHTQLGDNAAVAISGMGFTGGPFVEGIEVVGMLGAVQGTASFFSKNKQHIFSLSMGVSGAAICEERDCQSADVVLFMPSIAYRGAFHRRWAFLLEWLMPMASDESDMNGKINFLLYGLQVHGEIMFSDFGFLMPIIKDVTSDIMKVFPLGFPYFTLGFKI